VGYTGARLAPIFSPTPARITARRMAEHSAEHFRKRVAEATPVDHSGLSDRVPGSARASWRVKPVLGPIPSLSREEYLTGIESWDHVTRLLEYGTGRFGPHRVPYVIRPKTPGGVLRFWSGRAGRWVFARSVLNPGQHAQRPLATGAAITEVELRRVLQPDLQEWRAMVEMIARLESARRA
jgi:hypothetical protein